MTTYNIDWASKGDEPSIIGKEDITLPSGSTDVTSTSIPLTGRGLSNYGEIQQENFIRLMENFASETAPNYPTIGQKWFDPIAAVLYICVDPAYASNLTTYDHTDSLKNPNSLVWTQVWPASGAAVYAGREEYNALATRINRVVGAPSTYDPLSATDPETGEWGWGQTGNVTDLVSVLATTTPNHLPIFSDALTAAYPGGANFALPFDNSAWCRLIAVMHKAQQAVYGDLGIVDPSDPDLAVTDPLNASFIQPEQRVFWGMINDGRHGRSGTAAYDVARSTDFEFGGAGLFPSFFLEAGWGERGIALKNAEWDQLNNAVDLLEAGRFVFPVASMESSLLTQGGAVTTITSWTGTVTQTTTMTFATAAAARAFFNTGGFVRLNASSTSVTVPAGGDQSWNAFLTQAVNNLVFDYKGLGKKQVSPSPFVNYMTANAPAVAHGFYDLLDFANGADFTQKQIFSENRSVATAYFTGTSGVTINARITQVAPTLILEFAVTYVEDGGDIIADLTSTVSSFKKNEVNMEAPEIAHPTATYTAIA